MARAAGGRIPARTAAPTSAPSTAQRTAAPTSAPSTAQHAADRLGHHFDQIAPNAPPLQRSPSSELPERLKAGVENLSGVSMDDVKVHYNSARPAQLSAHAYAHGNDIHLGPDLERHLPHEAWHVVQQTQGRVQPARRPDEER